MGYRALDSVLRHIRKLAPLPGDALLGDGALLDRFVTQRDERAFETLLHRHGPMVLGVCRRMLRDPQMVEDAFQVTFIVFLRRAHSLRRRELLANWLYGVAYRTALKARGTVAKRALREQPLRDDVAPKVADESIDRDLKPVLDEVIQQLPAKYRQPILFCYLEGNTVNEAAARLGWPAGTVAGRLARAKEMLRMRLIKRGITVSAPLLAASLSGDALGGVPPALIATALRAAAVFAGGQIGSAGSFSPSVSLLVQGVLKAMFISRLKIAATILLTIGALGGGIVTYSKVAGQHPERQRANSDRVIVQQPAERQVNKDEQPELANLAALGKEKVQAILLESKFGERMTALLTARYQAAFDECKARQDRYISGRETLDMYIGSSLRLLEAERELSTKKAHQLLALENHWQRMKAVHKITQLKFDNGTNAVQDLAQAQFYALQAEIWVERAK